MEQGYVAPNGNWYQTPHAEIKHHQDVLDTSRKFAENYRTLWNGIGKPSTLYLALRAVGHLYGITKLNPEIEGVINYFDAAACGAFYCAGACKIAELLMGFDVRFAKKDLAKAKKRLGIEKKVAS